MTDYEFEKTIKAAVKAYTADKPIIYKAQLEQYLDKNDVAYLKNQVEKLQAKLDQAYIDIERFRDTIMVKEKMLEDIQRIIG